MSYTILTRGSAGQIVTVQSNITDAKLAWEYARNGHQFPYQYGQNKNQCWVEKYV